MKLQQESSPVNVLDTQAATAALHRAAETVRKTAIDTDIYLVVMENGKVVRIPSQQLRQRQGLAHGEVK